MQVYRNAGELHFMILIGMMMRLVGGEGSFEGRLEVHDSGKTWASVCSNNFNKNDANVVCKYLGHPSVEEVYNVDDASRLARSEGAATKPWDLKCTGEEDNPFTCTKNIAQQSGSSTCNDVAIQQSDSSTCNDVAIKCSSKHMSHIVTSYIVSLCLYRGCSFGWW